MATAQQLIQNTYNDQLAILDARKKQQELDKINREKIYADRQKATNRGLYSTYMQAINPYGSNAEQRGIGGTAMSDYAKNQAYGVYLSGLGNSQNTYNEGLKDIENNWQSYLLSDSEQRLKAAQDRDNGLLALMQQEQERASGGSGRRYGGSGRRYGGAGGKDGLLFSDYFAGSRARPTNYSHWTNAQGKVNNGDIQSITYRNGKRYIKYKGADGYVIA